jgi:S1-C subfamily serine protease
VLALSVASMSFGCAQSAATVDPDLTQLERVKRAVIEVGQLSRRSDGEHFEQAGSGVAIGPGTIATVAHVVGHIAAVSVRVEGRTLPAKIDAIDRPRDIAILKLESGACRDSVPFGRSDGLRVGERLFSIGFSAGRSSVVSAGIYSGRYEPEDPNDVSGILTDAAMAPGASGGALVRATGELVGLNGVANVSFGIHRAVPIELVRRHLP